MKKWIFIINGPAGAGKDTFVQLVTYILNEYKNSFNTVVNFSSVDKVKEIAKLIGWTGGKSERERKFLHELKKLSEEYYDLPFQSMKEKVSQFTNPSNTKSIFLFLHIREPENITRAVNEFKATTILLTRDSVKLITSNSSDARIFDYKYDIKIENNGTLQDLKITAENFVKETIFYSIPTCGTLI